MGSEWPLRPLGELVHNFDSKRVPLSSMQRAQRPGPYPYHGATGVMDHVDGYLFEGLHLLVAEDGSVETDAGKPFLQLVDGKFWVNNHAHVLRGPTDDDTRYLYYALATIPIRPFMSGSVQAKLSQGNLNRITVPYPADARDRARIARSLGALDNRIELNRRKTATMESIEAALFKHWFVDFGPVRSKGASDKACLRSTVSDLFPGFFENSEVGPVPHGWKVGRLADILSPSAARIGLEQAPEYSATVRGLELRAAYFKKSLARSAASN